MDGTPRICELVEHLEDVQLKGVTLGLGKVVRDYLDQAQWTCETPAGQPLAA